MRSDRQLRSRRVWGRRALVASLGAIGAALIAAATTATAAGPFVAERETMQRHTHGVDHFDVWVCEVPADSTAVQWEELPDRVDLSAETATGIITERAVEYYRWLSQGRYEPRFTPRGEIPLGPEEEFNACTKRAEQMSAGAEGVIAVSNVAGDPTADAGPDRCQDQVDRLDPCAGRPDQLPKSHRHVELGAYVFTGYGEFRPHPVTILHELGHTLTWPHSFTGRFYIDVDGAKAGIEYDDPVDIMAFEPVWRPDLHFDLERADWSVPKATQVFNRYAAGWLPRDAAVVHGGSRARTYEVVAIGNEGVQLLALPGANRSTYLTIESRLRRGFDLALPRDGVSLHVVDQRPSACKPSQPDAKGCWGADARLLPAPTKPLSLRGFLGVGDSRQFGEVNVRVLSRTPNGFRVRVSRGRATLPRTIPVLCLLAPELC